MDKSTHMGRNRTGIDMSPIHSQEMLKGAEQYAPTPATETLGMEMPLAAFKREFIEHAEAIGSVPIPGTVKGALKSVMNKVTGRNPEVLLNKLGERLAYERSGVRLYESFLVKCEAHLSMEPTAFHIPLDQVRGIRDQEAEHFHILKECIEFLGADPTAQTPDADVSAVAAMGHMKVITDHRTTLSQCLEAILSVELTDNAAWELLIKLAEDMGLDDMADRFRHALQQEETHVMRVRNWYEQSVREQTGIATATKH